MSSRPLLKDDEIVTMYMNEWYRYHHDEKGQRRPAAMIEQKRLDLLEQANQQIARQKKTSSCVLL